MNQIYENQLIDRFNRKHDYLRVSVTDKCNLRCTYCMPNEKISWINKNDLLTKDEIIRLVRLFVSLGIKKLRITGGEPLIRHDIEQIMQELADLRHAPGLQILAMTSNGTLLKSKLQFLRQINLQALNISLDTLRADRFMEITRRDEFDQVWQAINEAIRLDFPTIKLNVVVMAGYNEDEIIDFAQFAYHNRINVRFIEFMPFKDNNWQECGVFPYAKMKSLVENTYRLLPIKSDPSSVAKNFSIEGGLGSVSFITSMTESFCSSCSRLRLTADGSFKSCLFSPAEINLRDFLRHDAKDAELGKLIQQSLSFKPEAHPPAQKIASDYNRTMIDIGG